MISVFLNTSVLLRYIVFCVLEVLCTRFHRTYLSPLQVIRLAHHQIEVAVVVDAGTQTGIIIHKFLFCHLKHKPDSFIVRLATLVHEVHMYGGHTVCCGYRLGQSCRRTAIRFWAFCVQRAHRLWGWQVVMRAGREGDPLVSSFSVCAAIHQSMCSYTSTGK